MQDPSNYYTTNKEPTTPFPDTKLVDTSQEARMGGPPAFFGEAGVPVPQVDPEDLKTVFQVFRDIASSHPGGQVGVCLEVFKQACKPGVDIRSLTYRAMVLQLFISQAKEQLAPWTKGEQLDDAVFREAAQIPMEWIGVGIEQQGFPFDTDELLRHLRGEAA